MRRAAPLIILLVLPLTGCLYSREIVHTRRDIERETRVDFDRGFVLSMGPSSLRTVEWLAGMVPEEEAQMGADYLRDIRRVKVGVFSLRRGRLEEVPDLRRLRRFERGKWEVAVRFRDEQASGFVFYRAHRDTVRDLFIVVLDEEELVLARVEGRLNHLVAQIVADREKLTRRFQEEW